MLFILNQKAMILCLHVDSPYLAFFSDTYRSRRLLWHIVMLDLF